MLKQKIKPLNNKISLEIPDCYINKELEFILYEVNESSASIQNHNDINQIEKLFLTSKDYIIDPTIDIINIENGINNDIF